MFCTKFLPIKCFEHLIFLQNNLNSFHSIYFKMTYTKKSVSKSFQYFGLVEIPHRWFSEIVVEKVTIQ